MIGTEKDLSDILNAIVMWAEKESKDGLLASILLLDQKGERLLHGAAPTLPEEYNKAIHGISIGPAVGSCGTAAFTRQQVIVDDIATDPLWKDFKDLALRFGLRACWSTPLIGKKGNVLGTFAMYYRHSKKPSQHDLQVIRLIHSTTVLAIEWKRTEKERKKLLEMERQANEKTKKERQNFYNLLMSVPAAVAVLRGPDHVFDLANDLYLAAAQRDPGIIGKPAREVLPELVEQGFFQLLDRVYQTGEPFYGNEALVKVDKGQGEFYDLYLNFVYQPIQNEEGITEGILFHGVDVTELVKAKKRAEESEERFRSFVLNSPMPIGIYIGREMRIQTANDAILKAWEKDRSVIGKTFREALPELEGQPFYQLLDDVYTTGNTYQAAEDEIYLLRNGRMTLTYWNITYKALRT
jgi:PAS domain-containing protein